MRPRLLHQLLEASAGADGDRPAVIQGQRTLTFRELDCRANQLAHLLIECGVRPGDRVGLYLDKSPEAVVGIYGALKAGAVYVPVDPEAPPARAGYILRDCGVRCLLTGGEKAERWRELADNGAPLHTIVVLNSTGVQFDRPPGSEVLDAAAVDARPESAPDVPTIDLDLAYILYTSGSTGSPKGVMLSHLNAMSFVSWAVDEFQVRADDRLSSHAPLHFDLSVFDLFAAAEAGAVVVIVPSSASVFPVEVRRFIQDNGITIWYSVPSVLSALALRGGLEPDDLPALRTVLFAGEVFPTKYLRSLMNRLPHSRFANLYGPTETNVCTWYEVPSPPEGDSPIPIGRPIANVDVFAVTDDGRRAAPGEVGELYVRGTTVMDGYWGDPERTARQLCANPLAIPTPDLVYRTGDLVQEGDDGNYRFLGRRDAQIKSRGYRIELGEIETALYSHPAVAECAVVAIPDELVTNRIRAYVVAHNEIGEADLRRYCADRIPRYMIPEQFELLDQLPKTATGKTDRQALRRVALRGT